jgi:hypothetical protein
MKQKIYSLSLIAMVFCLTFLSCSKNDIGKDSRLDSIQRIDIELELQNQIIKDLFKNNSNYTDLNKNFQNEFGAKLNQFSTALIKVNFKFSELKEAELYFSNAANDYMQNFINSGDEQLLFYYSEAKFKANTVAIFRQNSYLETRGDGKCGAGILGGFLAGGLGGCKLGAEAGIFTGPQGALTGCVVGGLLGALGGGLTGAAKYCDSK